MLNDMQVNNVLDEEFKLTTEPVVMDNATEYELHEIQPDTLAISNPQATNWRLQLKNLNAYVNPARAYLEVSCRMTDNANPPVDLGANADATIQNHILSLFRRATLRVGGQIVETVNECHVSKGLVQPLLHYSQDYSHSSGTSEMFYPDGPGLATDKDPYVAGPPISDSTTYNDGYKKLGVHNVQRPDLFRIPDGKVIGGHCVIPNAVLLKKMFPKSDAVNAFDYILRYSK